MLPAAPRVPRCLSPPLPADPVSLSRAAVASARRHGFVAAGILRAGPALTHEIFLRWLKAGHHAGMRWLERHAAARKSPESVLPSTRSIIAVARGVAGRGHGNVARYARGEDYHDALRRELRGVIEDLRLLSPAGARFRVCVDTAPLLEREIAARAGLGFLGKNGLLIVPGVGSEVVVGEILTDLELAPSAAPADPFADRCGTCRACLEACPTNAFVGPRLVDARRCVAYLTIEKRGPFTPDEEATLGGRLFGCDVCQDVCPFNAALDPEGPPRGPFASIDPEELVGLDEAAFRARFSRTALWRATAEGLARNARAAVARAGAAR